MQQYACPNAASAYAQCGQAAIAQRQAASNTAAGYGTAEYSGYLLCFMAHNWISIFPDYSKCLKMLFVFFYIYHDQILI